MEKLQQEANRLGIPIEEVLAQVTAGAQAKAEAEAAAAKAKVEADAKSLALFDAAKAEDFDTVKRMLSEGAAPDWPNPDWVSLLTQLFLSAMNILLYK